MKALPVMALTIIFFTVLTSRSFAGGKMGAGSSGGGDSYVLDFIKTATQSVYPWLIKNENVLVKEIVVDQFLIAVNPQEVVSIDHVYESCDGSNLGREVEACYSSDTNLIYLSRTKYRINDNSLSKQGVVAHEIFRKMGIEGDNYEITKLLTNSAAGALSKLCQFKVINYRIDTITVRANEYIASKKSAYNKAVDECKDRGYFEGITGGNISFIPFISNTAEVTCSKKVPLDADTLKLEKCSQISSCSEKLFTKGQLNEENRNLLAELKVKNGCEELSE